MEYVQRAANGLRFFFHTTLKRDRTTFTIPAPRQRQTLPAILSREEVGQVIAHATNPKHRTMLLTTYAAGLRLNEVLHLRVTDIDSARMTIRVEQGKGGKDRSTVLQPRLLEELLRWYWKLTRPRPWLFPSEETGEPLHPTALQRAYQTAKLRARITKPGGIHALRHAFATHRCLVSHERSRRAHVRSARLCLAPSVVTTDKVPSGQSRAPRSILERQHARACRSKVAARHAHAALQSP